MIELFTASGHHIDEEMTIVLVCNGNCFSIIALLNEVHLDVSALVFLFESLLIGLEAISLHLKVLILFVADRDSTLGIVSYDNVDHIKLCVHSSS